MPQSLSPEDYIPQPPENTDFGIGVVGCGSIVQGAHLPAYQAWKLRVVACCDLNPDAAKAAAQKFDIPFHTTRIEEVLDHPGVDILDLAVHASVRLQVIRQIAAHPKKPRAILTQKPLALELEEAERIVRVCEDANILLAVNQQQRWSPSNVALRHVMQSGWLGHVYSLVHFVRGNQDDPNSWYVGVPNFNIVDHGIHFFDLSRHLLGKTPVRVKATTVRVPGQNAVTPMIYTACLEYDPQAQVMATLHFNNIIPTNETTGRFEWLVDGTKGTAILNGQTLEVVLRDEPRHKHVFQLENPSFPVNFAAAMGEVMRALSENRAPQTLARDNLNSIRIAYAAVESSETGRAVELS